MAATPSTMQLSLGDEAPDFTLRDAVSGKAVSRSDMASGRALLVLFICNHCPFVIHVRDEISRIAADYMPRGVRVVAINANDVDHYPQDGPEHMRELAESEGWRFPYLFDADQSVAKEFRAACTPDVFLFDSDLRLAYRGQIDDSRPGRDVPVTGADLRAAIDAVLAGRAVSPEQKPSMGCNIKWAPGKEPEYWGA